MYYIKYIETRRLNAKKTMRMYKEMRKDKGAYIKDYNNKYKNK